jgi:hypothetical protein
MKANSEKFRYFRQIVAAGANPVQITRGIEKTAKALVNELQKMSKEVSSDYHLILLLTLVKKKFLLALNNHVNTTQPTSCIWISDDFAHCTRHKLQTGWYHKRDIYCYKTISMWISCQTWLPHVLYVLVECVHNSMDFAMKPQ